MSLTRRLYDLARANLGVLLDREPERELTEFTDEELEAELVQRSERKRRQDQARIAREIAEQAARERNQQRAAASPSSPPRSTGGASARTAPPPPPKASGPASGAARSAGPLRPDAAERAERTRLYAILETPDGADFETVKRNFRRLMRLHHPDLAAHTPDKQRAALELTKKLTAAYDQLERRLTRPSR